MAALKGEFDESVREPLADKWERLAKEADAQSGRPRHLTVKVPAGPFKYGPEGVVVNLPEYEIDKYEVSNAQYRKFVKWLIQDPHPKATSKKLAMVRHPDGPWAVKEYIPRYFPELSEFAEGLIRSYRDRIQGEAGMDEGREGKDARWFQNDPKAYLEHIERERNRFRALTDAGVTGDDYPVVDVTWYAAYAYAKWLGRKLPSAEQWDKAARGADGRDMPAGRWSSRDAALYNGGNSYEFKEDGFPFLAPVASMVEGASPYGAQHMSGNAWEWIDKPGECRGGSWRRCQGHLSLNCRDGETRPGAEHRYEDSGFRTVSGTP
ncbi:MAG: formylglycine-generating enzyme family protein [Planctomycetota bacterium]|nr:formylglycine-generating enzyme family protein [Planctomycetota bacterium]